MILDGKIVAEKIYNELKNEILPLEKKPKLGAILIGNNSSSIRYIKQKQKWAEYIGVDFELLTFDENISQISLLEEINKLNIDENISGFIIQLPLPKHINEQEIINSINPEKDVDGFHPINQGKIVIGDETGLKPCTPAGVIELCKFYNIDLIGKNIVIIGRSNIVGKPLANMLINMQATLTICNSKTKNIDFYTKNADIIITAMGSPEFLTTEKINKDTVVIDVGFSVIDGKIYGDCDFENIIQNGNKITPVPGGVGALTVAMLMKNTLKAYKK
ncbi:MAG: bifunctional 5,10-methylenetetrahydrofolate dehydrogenase/5,10-methenyltetrahydrofolate cyclohydrolase [Candidatus Gracilibacteria bacterium]|nr:bifunctional 5,10-methylenetetrahydrofolate dehydrogenase/5,10-methenyltetrahydrofolate cyclohydrolase [Candidatus Gracilibacteria bacterium]